MKKLESHPSLLVSDGSNSCIYVNHQHFKDSDVQDIRPEAIYRDCLVSHTFYNTYEDYAHYINALPPEIAQEIKLRWKDIYKYRRIQMSEYSDLKSVFRDKDSNVELYNRIRKQDPYQLGRENQKVFYSFEYENKILGFILFIFGQGDQFFCEFEPNLDTTVEIPPLIYFQYAIMNFIELGSHFKLHFKYQDDFVRQDQIAALGLEAYCKRSLLQSTQDLNPYDFGL